VAKVAIASEPVTDAIESAQLFEVDVDYVSRPRALVSQHWHLWLQLFSAHHDNGFEVAADGRERESQRVGAAPQGAGQQQAA
jgi:hypothetical protein